MNQKPTIMNTESARDISLLAPKDRILQTALRLFYSHGIHSTGIDTIIAESGVAKMTFYKHFPSKQDLILQVLKHSEEIAFSRLTQAIDRIASPRKRILALFDYLEKWFQDPQFRGCAFINTTTEYSDPKSEECRFSAHHKARMLLLIEEIVREAELKNPKKTAEQLLLLFDGATVRAQTDRSPRSALLAKDLAVLLLNQQKSAS